MIVCPMHTDCRYEILLQVDYHTNTVDKIPSGDGLCQANVLSGVGADSLNESFD